MLEQDDLSRFGRAWLGPGIPDSVCEPLQEAGLEVLTLPLDRAWEAPAEGELVVLAAGDPTLSALVLCSRLKDEGQGRVAVALVSSDAELEYVEPLARFAMADAVSSLAAFAADPIRELKRLLTRQRPQQSVDVLLARLEDKLGLGGDARELADRVLLGLSKAREDSFLDLVTDAETGLFIGSFMAFKLEEEFKRSTRFRTPLAVLLLDLPRLRELADGRDRVLGEVAGVFLNECRDIDWVGRYDDSSFLLLLPHTGSQGAVVVARRTLDLLRHQIESPVPLDPAVAIVTVPRTGIDRKDDLLDLARLTLVAAWAESGERRVRIAD